MPVGERTVLLYSPVAGSTTQLERNCQKSLVWFRDKRCGRSYEVCPVRDRDTNANDSTTLLEALLLAVVTSMCLGCVVDSQKATSATFDNRAMSSVC